MSVPARVGTRLLLIIHMTLRGAATSEKQDGCGEKKTNVMSRVLRQKQRVTISCQGRDFLTWRSFELKRSSSESGLVWFDVLYKSPAANIRDSIRKARLCDASSVRINN